MQPPPVQNPAAADRCAARVERLNEECYCISLDREALRREFSRACPTCGVDALIEGGPLFSPLPVFVARPHLEAMRAVIAAVETVVASPLYREAALAWAPAIARHEPHSPGVFFGYDFHLGPSGPKLIEINTNAGGAMLNAVLARAQRACCDAVVGLSAGAVDPEELETEFFSMFVSEWRRCRGEAPLATVAIVDDTPQRQFLGTEFELFARMFERKGLSACVADARELQFRDGALWRGETRIDLVYNRLTDFDFSDPAHAALAQAYLAGAAVITPHPRAHALYADKRNLALLSDAATLRGWGIAETAVAALERAVPHAVRVSADNAEALWSRRKELFFKPASGFGSRAAYRGDKLTRRVWKEILAGDYIAQQYVAPSLRHLAPMSDSPLKLDVRCYVYAGRIQLVAARRYRGQTTNFRTPNGGFATVFSDAVLRA